MTKRATDLSVGDVLPGLGRIAEVNRTVALGLVKCRDEAGSWVLLLDPRYEVTVEPGPLR